MTHDEREAIGARVRLAIVGPARDRGLTIKQVSTVTGVSEYTVSAIVHGSTPSTITAMKLGKLWPEEKEKP